MISAQPTNVWTLKNCKFRAWSLEHPTKAIAFQTADTDGSNIHPLGNVVRTDSDGFVYTENNMQLPNGCFVAEEATIEASRDNGLTYPISWIVRSSSPLTRVKAPDGTIDLLNTNEGGLWGENLGRYDGKVYFEDINGKVKLNQMPTLDIEHLGVDSVGTDQIKNGSVTRLKLANSSVTHPKLADDAVGINNIITGSIQQILLSGSMSSWLRFRGIGLFSAEPNEPTRLNKDDFILFVPTDGLRNRYVSTTDMENKSFVVIVPAYEDAHVSKSEAFYLFINSTPYVSEERILHDSTHSTYFTYGFIIYKSDNGGLVVCRYLANGHWNR